MKISPLIAQEELQMLKEDMEFMKKVNGELLSESPNDEFAQAITFAIGKLEKLLSARDTESKLDLEQEVEFWAYANLVDTLMNSIVETELGDDDIDDEDDDDDSEEFTIEDFVPKKK